MIHEMAGALIKGAIREGAHLKNKLEHGKEKAEQIKRQKYEKERRRHRRQANAFGLLIGVGFAGSAGMALGVGGVFFGVVFGIFTAWLFRWLGEGVNPYK
jgi:hypothetical protein